MENKIELVEWFSEHWYKIQVDDKEFKHIASVTTKLSVEKKSFVERWRGDVGNREADLRLYEASERGKRIHYAWNTYLMGGTILFNPPQRLRYTDEDIQEIKKTTPFLFVLRDQGEMVDVWKLQRFFEAVNPKVLHAEITVYSLEDDIAGTLDNAFFIEKGTYDVNGSRKLVIPESGVYIADLKSGKTVEEGMFRQIAPYAYCYQRMGLGIPSGGLILHSGSSVKSGIEGFSVLSRTAEQLKEDLVDYHHLAAIWKRSNPNASPRIFDFPSRISRVK